MGMLHGEVTHQIIGAAYEVYNELGYGFLEKVYRNSLQIELGLRNIASTMETPIRVRFKNQMVGEYFADLFVEQSVMVELKVEKEYNSKHEAQLLNELKATGTRVGLLINFGRERLDFKRMIF